jgi:hypothetical protein
MIKPELHEVCSHGDFCGHRDDFFDFESIKCEGVNPDRDCDFVCKFFIEDNSSSEKIHGSLA